MIEPTSPHGAVYDLFADAGPGLRRLLDGALENSELLAADYMTLRDLLELSGYQREEPLYAVLLVLLTALDEGSLCIEVNEQRLAERLASLAGADAVGNWPQRILHSLEAHGYPELIGDGSGPVRPVVRRRLGGRTFLYFQKQHRQERELAALLRQRLAADGVDPGTERLPRVLREVLEERPVRVGGVALRLNPQQRLALALALLRRFVIVSGGPGTGKTSIVLTVLRCLARLPGFDANRVALAAPTGRAAQRLNDSLRQGLATLSDPPGGADAVLPSVMAQTLHRLLGYHPERGSFRHHAENPLAVDAVIVDEVSMVGLELMSHLFRALPPDARVVLLGDKDQLPSVDAGAVLANLTATGERPGYRPAVCRAVGELFPGLELSPAHGQHLADALVVLEKNHRSEPEIRKAAIAINAGHQAVAAELPVVGARDVDFAELERLGGCRRLDGTADPVLWATALRRWVEHHYWTRREGGASFLERADEVRLPSAAEPAHREALDELFATLHQARILTLIREGSWGCAGVNRFVEQEIRRRVDPGGRGRLFPGAAILVTRTDHRLQLFNGDVGLALRTDSGGFRVVFPRAGGYVSFPADALPAHELAFAMTVHKSQGAEYDQVLLVFPPQGARRLLTRETVYTGVTRARALAILCGSAEVIRTAVGRRVEREANLLAADEDTPHGASGETA